MGGEGPTVIFLDTVLLLDEFRWRPSPDPGRRRVWRPALAGRRGAGRSGSGIGIDRSLRLSLTCYEARRGRTPAGTARGPGGGRSYSRALVACRRSRPPSAPGRAQQSTAMRGIRTNLNCYAYFALSAARGEAFADAPRPDDAFCTPTERRAAPRPSSHANPPPMPCA